jgi:hypothetical protein
MLKASTLAGQTISRKTTVQQRKDHSQNSMTLLAAASFVTFTLMNLE